MKEQQCSFIPMASADVHPARSFQSRQCCKLLVRPGRPCCTHAAEWHATCTHACVPAHAAHARRFLFSLGYGQEGKDDVDETYRFT